MFYEVSAGSREGGADVVQWQETTETRVVLSIPRPTYSESMPIFVTVRSINPSGAFNTANAEAFVTF